jgi:hypothetical protein
MKRRRSRSKRQVRHRRIRFRGHLWTRFKFAQKYGKRKAAKLFGKRRKYVRRRSRNGPYPHFTVIKGGGKRRKYRRPKLRVIRGRRSAANRRRR